MPRQARLDAPDTLHHVMVRGIERTAIFRDDADRSDFIARLAALAEAGVWVVYAWALLPNHAHLLVRTGTRPLPRSMRSLLTGYAGAFNRRHKRVGHLFQNRYKSIVVEEEPYLLELVRYLHLNPLRANVVPSPHALDRFPWTGHSALCGTVPRPWQDTQTILTQFGPTPARARRAYRAFLAAGLSQGQRRELQGGGLVRSLGGWQAVTAARRTGAPVQADARVLGSGEFVATVVREAPIPRGVGGAASRVSLETLTTRLAARLGVAVPALLGQTQTRPAVTARQLLAYVWVEVLGRRASDLARALGQTRGNISTAARRGAVHAARWQAEIPRWCR
ncbi:MAG TPA: transposase, partial [Candidatus Baltobacteraceae bacterium]|nr:transposase [Candidatus Baltobacteraceae bacterium]